MKLNRYIGLAALAVAFTSCQDDGLESSRQQDGIYTLSAKMVDGAAMSRAQIVLGNAAGGKESFMWNEGDKITLYQEIDGQHTEHVFTITDYSEEGEGDKRTATFVSETPVSSGTAVAFYPSGLATDFDGDSKRVIHPFQTTLDFSTGTAEEVWADYLKKNMVMRANVTLSREGGNVLNFEHITSLARITYKNESGADQSVNEIILGGDQIYMYSMTVWLDYGWIGGMGSNGYHVAFDNLTVKAGESFDFYILFGPADFADGEMHIHLNTASATNREPLTLPTSTIAAANDGATEFEAGKRYWFKVTETEDGLAWTKDVSGEGDGEDTYPEVSEDSVLIKDKGFSSALYRILGGENVILENGYAVISKEYAGSVKDLRLADDDEIISMEGLGYFTDLETLYYTNEKKSLTSLDVSKNVKLKDLQLVFAQIDSLNVSENVNLEGLLLVAMPLTSLDVSKNVLLTGLNCRECRIPELDITPLDNLTELYCGGQMDDIAIDVTMTAAQKEMWDNGWKDRWENTNVNVIVPEQMTTVTIQNAAFSAALKAVLDSLFTTTAGQLNNEFLIKRGTINGSLVFENVSDEITTSDYVKYSTDVEFGENTTGWDKAGIITE